MPPRNVCVNPELLAVTEHLKNECESDNMKRTWNKCIKSLKGHQTVITEKDDLRALHGWGHYTSGEVWKRYAGVIQGFPLDEAPGPSRSRPKKTPSNSRSSSTKVSPTKRALEETVEDFSSLMDMAAPLPKRARPTATTYTMTEAAPSISAVPQSAHPVPPTLNPNDPRQLEGFGFCYLDERNRRVKSSEEAYISVLGGEAVFKVEFSALQASHRWAMTFIGQSQTNGNGLCVGFVSQVVAELLTQCPGIQIQPPQPSRIVPAPSKLNPVPLKQRASTLGGPSNSLLQAEFSKAKRKNNSLDPTRMLSDKNAAALADIRSARAFPGSSTRHMGSETTKEISPRATQTEHRSSPVNASLSRSSTTLPTIPIQAPLKRNATLPDETPSVPARRAAPRASNHIPAPRPLDDLELELEDSQPRFTQTSQTLPSSPTGSDANDTIYSSAPAPNYLQPFQPHILPARSYNISMVLDIREGRQGNETLIPDLEARGVNIERRPLAIGDVAWIATKAYVDGLGGPQECVLDFIVERKRMDDLITSVKDGRFHEQKFRLKESGIGQVYYLIEHHNTSKYRENYDQTIDTVMSSIQIVDGFKVKETASLKETAVYLAQIHKTLVRIHQDRDLHIVPTHLIRRHSYTNFQKHLRDTQPDRAYLTTWDAFAALNAKSGLLTARECWARMLLCVNGLSPEKVAAIIDLYDTPRALWESFVAAEEEEVIERQREYDEEMARQAVGKGKGRAKKSNVVPAKHMLTQMPDVTGRRKIGAALSEKVYELFRAQSY